MPETLVRILFAWCVAATAAHSQDYAPPVHLTQRQGLSHRWVNDIFQDSKGLLWFSTVDGLNRYDGNEFALFKPSEADLGSPVESDWITWAMEGRDGNLRVSGHGGLLIFDTRTERFTLYPHGAWNGATHPSYNIIGLDLKIRDGIFWKPLDFAFSLRDVVAFYDFTGTGKPRLHKTLESTHPLQVVPCPGGQKVWVWVADTGWWLVDIENGTKKGFGLNGRKALPRHTVTPSDETERVFWLPANDGSETFVKVPFPAGFDAAAFQNCHQDNNGNWWFTATDGQTRLYRYGFDDRQVREVGVLPLAWLNDVCEDREGTVWVAHQMGVEKFVFRRKQFENYLHTPFPPESEPPLGAYCGTMAEDPFGNVFLETRAGLFVIEKDGTTQKAPFTKPPLPGQADFAEDGPVFSDAEGFIWVLNFGALVRYDPRRGTVERMISPLHKGYFAHLVEDGQGRLWLKNSIANEARSETVLFDKKTGKFSYPKCRETSIEHGWIQPGQNTLWAFHSKGLVRINCAAETVDSIQLYRQPRSHRQGFFHEGFMWLATAQGLVKVDTQTWQATTYGRAQGLPDNFVYSMLPNGGSIWLGTGEGLCRFDIRSGETRSYFTKDGLSHNEFNSTSVLKTSDGRLFMGGLNGVNAFRPAALAQAGGYRATLHWMKFTKYDGRKKALADLPVFAHDSAHSLVLHHTDKSFSFRFALTSYRDIANNRYAYRMENLEENWQPLGNSSVVSYPHIPPGEYVLRVRATDPGGNESLNQLALRIVMLRPWYARWWAWLTYALALGAASFFIYRHLLRRKLEHAENLRLKELDSVKTRLYTSITHEFRTPLTVILGLTRQWLKREIPSPELAEEYRSVERNGQRLLQLVNQVLDLRKLEVGSLKLNLVQGDVVPLLRYIFDSFHSFAVGKDLDFQCDVPDEPLVMDHDPDKLTKIVSNLLSNAIKFTPSGGRVSLRAGLRNLQGFVNLELTVSDTGEGIPAEDLPHIFKRFYQADNAVTRAGAGTGIGLTLTKELVELLSGKIEVESTVGKGSVFTVTLPVKQSPLTAKGEPHWQQPANVFQEIASETPDLHSPLRGSGGNGKPLVLIVEDHAEVARYTASCLNSPSAGGGRGEAYQIRFAANGDEGIRLAQELVPDLVISDVMMPLKDGFELTRTLKNDPGTSHIPIILLTARAEVEDRLEGLRRGADAYLSKPFHEEELQILAVQMLDLRKKLQARYSNLAVEPTYLPSENGAPQPVEATAEFDFELEDAFFQKALGILEAHLAEPDFSNHDLCRQMHMSSTQLHRKLSALTGHAPNQLLNLVRLRKAKELLAHTDKPIADIAYETGFNQPSYFARAFAKSNGMTPKEYRERLVVK